MPAGCHRFSNFQQQSNIGGHNRHNVHWNLPLVLKRPFPKGNCFLCAVGMEGASPEFGRRIELAEMVENRRKQGTGTSRKQNGDWFRPRYGNFYESVFHSWDRLMGTKLK